VKIGQHFGGVHESEEESKKNDAYLVGTDDVGEKKNYCFGTTSFGFNSKEQKTRK
jgi:hypothetical protein